MTEQDALRLAKGNRALARSILAEAAIAEAAKPPIERETEMLDVRLFDNGGETLDRYTAIFTPTNGDPTWYLAMSEHPFHPQGFGQHGDGDVSGVMERDAELPLDDAPEDVRRCIEQDVKAYTEAANAAGDPEPMIVCADCFFPRPASSVDAEQVCEKCRGKRKRS